MVSILAPLSERAYALLRIVSGFLFAFHGVQKTFGLWTDYRPAIGSQLWLGGIIELVAGTAICLGLFAAPAAFLASGTMAVAYFQFHWKLQLGKAFFPAINEGESAVLYCLLFLYIACKGGGRWSLELRRRTD